MMPATRFALELMLIRKSDHRPIARTADAMASPTA